MLNTAAATETRIPVLPSSPEGELLRRVALWPLRKPVLTREMLDGIDRPAMIKLAAKHRLLPPFSWAVAASGLMDLWPELQTVQRRTSMRALRQAAATIGLLDLFEKAGCRALVLKGQALSMQIYDRTDMRMSSDVDFLVDPAMMVKAHEIMIETGFTPSYPVSVETLAFVNKDQIYTLNKLRVELHWRLFDNQAFLPWSFDYLWSKRASVLLMETKQVPTLPREHHIFYQMLHGLRHGWRRGRWLADLAIPLQTETDRTTLFALAEQYHFTSLLIHTAHLAQDVFEVDLPVPVQATWKQRLIGALVNRQIRRLVEFPMASDDHDLTTWAKQRFHEKILDLLACPSFKCLLIEIKQYFIGIGDVIDAKLPKHLMWVYILIRPFLLVRRMLLRKRSHPRQSP